MLKVPREVSGGTDAQDHPLTWRPLRDATNHVVSASFVCPNGHRGILTDHEIHPDGRVTPSVQCHTGGCDFHHDVTLAGWTPVGKLCTSCGIWLLYDERRRFYFDSRNPEIAHICPVRSKA